MSSMTNPTDRDEQCALRCDSAGRYYSTGADDWLPCPDHTPTPQAGDALTASGNDVLRDRFIYEMNAHSAMLGKHPMTDEERKLISDLFARAALSTTPTMSAEDIREAAALNPILSEIVAEVEKATRKFPTWPTRIIDAGNVVTEEAGEAAKAILQCVYEPHKSGLDDVREEIVQTAAMCIRFLASMDRYDLAEGPQHAQPPFAALTKEPSQASHERTE